MPSYAFGHTDPELVRLERQGQFLHSLTRDVFVRAGIQPGARVLDFGAGAGDVSVILSELVGPTGRVYAVDRAPEAVERARARFAARGADHFEAFVGDEAAVAAHVPAGGFDAIVGRLVLLHQPDPAATIVRLAEHLRPGGVMAFHEIEIDAGCWSSPHLPLLERVFGWIAGTLTRGGMPTDISARIADGFARAGLVSPWIIREGRVESGAESGAYDYFARTVGTLLPLTTRLGVATAEEIDIATLETRLRAEALASRARFSPVFFTAAWARRP